MFGSNFRDFVLQEQGQSSKTFEKSNSWDSGAEEEFEILESNNQEEATRDRHHSGDSGNCSEAEGEFEVLDGKIKRHQLFPKITLGMIMKLSRLVT
ncbi:hypothetical protein HET73_06315 [Wolbachia endosymbiont of Atemnus politus]|uniref:hypothetical protein n=1 Tax=Wolbachia endosymbiont of Atemnus politus TaxID=2682840 RepID=UPI001571F29F|nr:hypothetical protein [Wolbachia endosymbiont of Atemnus politus]NSM56940.1 hypothetical protein [Wolbachia endosymbiont of Atemnus politus]NSX83564.1 hypothetical protein [Wolbachia endosymbiont of Atemnus politus]